MSLRTVLRSTALAGALSACARDPVTMETIARPDTVAFVEAGQSACELHVVRVTDRRLDPTSIGTVAGRPVRAPENVQAWLRGELAQLQLRGIRVRFDDEPTPVTDLPMPRVDAEVMLQTAWMNALSTSMSVSVVMLFDFKNTRLSGGPTAYRGADTSLNWASGSGELQGLLDTAFTQILDKAAADVHAACPSPAPVTASLHPA